MKETMHSCEGGAGCGADVSASCGTSSDRVAKGADGRWTIEAPCKLNLGLRIFPARADGFHDLETWMVPISWHDTLSVSLEGPLTLAVSGRAEGIPTEVEKNLVGKAALRLARSGGIEARGRIELHKVVPPGGGLGGGSSDAANALVLLNCVWGLNQSFEQLEKIAGELGSDVPFFVRQVPAFCTGRGEIMTPLVPAHPLFAVLIIPPLGLATKPVYEAFDAGHQHLKGGEGNPSCSWASRSAEELNSMLGNDLEPAAFAMAPWLAEIRRQAANSAGQKVHLTGSGSTLFTLCSSGPGAAKISERITGSLGDKAVCVPVRILTQP